MALESEGQLYSVPIYFIIFNISYRLTLVFFFFHSIKLVFHMQNFVRYTLNLAFIQFFNKILNFSINLSVILFSH